MAHVGEEFALGAGRSFGSIARGFDFGQALCALGGERGLRGLHAGVLVDQEEREGRRDEQRDDDGRVAANRAVRIGEQYCR